MCIHESALAELASVSSMSRVNTSSSGSNACCQHPASVTIGNYTTAVIEKSEKLGK